MNDLDSLLEKMSAAPAPAGLGGLDAGPIIAAARRQDASARHLAALAAGVALLVGAFGGALLQPSAPPVEMALTAPSKFAPSNLLSPGV